MYVCLFMCISYLHTSMCTYAFVILMTANIHISVFSIDSQSLFFILYLNMCYILYMPGRVAQSVGHLTRKSGVLGSPPGLAT